MGAHAGGVRAAWSWTLAHGEANDMRLRIWRRGRLARAAGVPTPPDGWPGQRPDLHGRRGLVRVLDLDRDGEPEVMLRLWTGGAHCCDATEIFRWNRARRRYGVAIREWPDQTRVRVRDLGGDGSWEFVSGDGTFCFSCSYPVIRYPLRILRFERGRFVDATRAFPGRLGSDAARYYAAFAWCSRSRLWRDVSCTADLDAWAADEARLHRTAEALAFMRSLPLRRGYAVGLLRYLRHQGYVH